MVLCALNFIHSCRRTFSSHVKLDIGLSSPWLQFLEWLGTFGHHRIFCNLTISIGFRKTFVAVIRQTSQYMLSADSTMLLYLAVCSVNVHISYFPFHEAYCKIDLGLVAVCDAVIENGMLEDLLKRFDSTLRPCGAMTLETTSNVFANIVIIGFVSQAYSLWTF